MLLTSYDFETILESGFAAALENQGGFPEIRTSESVGEKPERCITIEMEVGAQEGERVVAQDFSFYGSTLNIMVDTPKGCVGPTNDPFGSFHAEMVARVRHALGTELIANLTAAGLIGGAPVTIEYCRPSGTTREADEDYRTSNINYEVAFSLSQ